MVFIWILLLCPGLAILLTWIRCGSVMRGISRFATWFSTLSYLFMWAGGFLYRPLLGPDYSSRLYLTISLNLTANFCLGAIVVIQRGWKRQPLCIGGVCAFVALVWFYALAVNASV